MTTTALFVMGSVAILVIGVSTRAVAELLLPTHRVSETPVLALVRLQYLLFGASVFSAFAPIYHCRTKRSGEAEDELANESLGKGGFWLMSIGFNAAFLPASVRGGPPPLLLNPAALWSTANTGVQLGALLFAVGTLLSVWNLILVRRRSSV